MVGVHLVDETELHLVADSKRPVDLSVFCAGLAVDELPPRVCRRRDPVDLDHVVFPLDALRAMRMRLRSVVMVLLVVPVMGVGVLLCSCGGLGGAATSSSAATPPLPVGRSVMPHFGQEAAQAAAIRGMGQTKAVGGSVSACAGMSFIPQFGHLPAHEETTSGCIGQA